MKKHFLKISSIALVSIAMISCGAESADEKSNDESSKKTTENVIEEEIEKSVKVEINDTDTTVTIETTKDGETTVEVLTGEDAAAYISEHEMGEGKENSSSEDVKIIVKKMDAEGDDINIDEILEDADLDGVGEGIKKEIKESLEEVEMKEGEIKIKTKVKSTSTTEK